MLKPKGPCISKPTWQLDIDLRGGEVFWESIQMIFFQRLKCQKWSETYYCNYIDMFCEKNPHFCQSQANSKYCFAFLRFFAPGDWNASNCSSVHWPRTRQAHRASAGVDLPGFEVSWPEFVWSATGGRASCEGRWSARWLYPCFSDVLLWCRKVLRRYLFKIFISLVGESQFHSCMFVSRTCFTKVDKILIFHDTPFVFPRTRTSLELIQV